MGRETMVGRVLPIPCSRGLCWAQNTGSRQTVAEWHKHRKDRKPKPVEASQKKGQD